MNGAPCARKWQVEAIRDGRLLGKDLESALRHRETCPECAQEERQLSALGHELAHLPDIGRDEVSVQRARQRLMAAHNETVVDPPRPGIAGRATGAVAVALAAAGWFVALHRKPTSDAARVSREIVEVHAQVGARWTKHQEASRIFVDLEDGEASFEIHPHPGRSVTIRLPDGEVLDMGTVLDVRVTERHTRHVAVREGRVSIHLNGHSAILLGPGETWDSEAAEVAPSAVVLDSSSTPRMPAAAPRPALSKASGAAVGLIQKPEPPSHASSAAPPSASPAASAEFVKAEDDAYLHIVDLLREAKDSEARSQAKAYLLRFPNGFRRIEVLNIATRGARDAGADETRMH